MSGESKAVFLSYASEDSEVAARIAEALKATGIEVWFDKAELRGGDAWDRQIRKQIHDCALFIPIISDTTQARAEGYFRREWKLAVDRTHDMSERVAFLLPVVVDNTSDGGADVPDKFREVQWTRLPGGATPSSFCQRVAALLTGPVKPSPGSATRQPAAPTPPPRPVARWILVGGVVAIVAVARTLNHWEHVTPKPAALPAAQLATAAQSTILEKSIAVLPFVDMSERHDQEYFGDGMAEEILNLLAKVPELKVIGRTSSFQFKGKTDDLRKIGMTLGAAYVVEGSVRRSGDHVRVTAQLIDTRDGAHSWSETYDRDVSDVLNVQGEIAMGLVRALQLEVTGSQDFRRRASPRNAEAYDVYLRGLLAMGRFDQRGFEEAVVDFRRALELDQSFVAAAEGLGFALVCTTDWGYLSPQTGWEQVRATAQATLKLDPDSAKAHAFLGRVHAVYDYDWRAAEREFDTAIALAPTGPLVLQNAALERIAVGKTAEAVRLLDTAASADPLEAGVHLIRAWAYVRLGRLVDAERDLRRAMEISSTYEWSHYFLGIVLLTEGKPEAALEEVQKETVKEAQMAGLAVIYPALHRPKDADAALAHLQAGDASGVTWATGLAYAYSVRGQRDQAFIWLDRAYAAKDSDLFIIKGDPLLKNLEGDLRYKALLRRMNLPE